MDNIMWERLVGLACRMIHPTLCAFARFALNLSSKITYRWGLSNQRREAWLILQRHIRENQRRG